MNDNKQQIPIARKTGMVIRELDDEMLIYDTERHQAHCLNKNAAVIWELCDGSRTVKDLSDSLSLDQNISERQRAQLVRIALDQLERAHLLDEPLAKSEIVNGMTRRQLMKVAGVTALIAIPVVSTIVAPTANQASTCLASGQPCTTSAECCSGLCSGNVCV